MPSIRRGRGSSPRVRGTVFADHAVKLRIRFIPACAENSEHHDKRAYEHAVHPRVCGEQPNLRVNNYTINGSSPRVRGTDWFRRQCQCSNRFIPACAGNRIFTIQAILRRTVHPRVCGEQVTLQFSGLGLLRFIPACAGNSPAGLPTITGVSVHPRVCGEQKSGYFIPARTPGSSPRVRGTVCPHPGRPLWSRFIPACAGNRSASLYQRNAGPVHPRVCGEQISCKYRVAGRGGSSPRVRGTEVPRIPKRQSNRFIPACAGNRR